MIPKTADEALDYSEESDFWMAAMNDEIRTLRSSGVFQKYVKISNLPLKTKLYETKWSFEKTKDEASNINYKAHVSVLDRRPINVDSLFSPCVNNTAMSVVLSEASKYKFDVKEVYIKNALHQIKINKCMYIRNPARAVDGPNICIKVNRCMRGMRNAHTRLYNRIYDVLLSEYVTSQEKHGVFYDEEKRLYILLHVDRILLVGYSGEIEAASSALRAEFEISENYWPSKFLGRNLHYYNSGRIKVFMKSHIEDIVNSYFSRHLDMFNLVEDERKTPIDHDYENTVDNDSIVYHEKLITAYKSLVPSLSYVSLTGRPDIAFAVSILFKRINNPTIHDLRAMASVIIYLNDTKDLGIHFGLPWQSPGFVGYIKETSNNYLGLNIYVDSNLSTSANGTSHMGMIVLLNSDVIYWSSKKIQQKTMSYFETSLCALEYALDYFQTHADMFEDLCYGLHDFNFHVHEIVYGWMQSSYIDFFRTDHIESKYDRVKELLCYDGSITLHSFSNTNPVIDLMIQSNASTYHSKLVNKLRFKHA